MFRSLYAKAHNTNTRNYVCVTRQMAANEIIFLNLWKCLFVWRFLCRHIECKNSVQRIYQFQLSFKVFVVNFHFGIAVELALRACVSKHTRTPTQK